ncbi:MAG: hypothetical protein LIO99_06155 [Clostridiales bacterium]|nr:hypothetical protein [Clostridiales bacterium]
MENRVKMAKNGYLSNNFSGSTGFKEEAFGKEKYVVVYKYNDANITLEMQ